MTPLASLPLALLLLGATTPRDQPSVRLDEAGSSLRAASPLPADLPLDTAPPLPACVTFKTQVRGSIGYDHLVVLTSACQKVAQCDVSTDVNPSPTHVSLAPGATETVLTFRGSPAREFTARVVCTLTGS